MQLNNPKFLSVNIIYLYDMFPLEKISLDEIKKTVEVPEVIYNKALNTIIAGDTENKWHASIQSTKLEYADNNSYSFKDRKIDKLYKLLSIVQFAIKAYGVNLRVQGGIDNSQTAGEYIRDNFLQNREKFEKKFNGDVFAYSTRVFLGKPENYRDLRFFPVTLQGNSIQIDYHLHKDIAIVDSDKLIKDTKDAVEFSIADFRKIIHAL